MESVHALAVPLVVDVGVGKNWSLSTLRLDFPLCVPFKRPAAREANPARSTAMPDGNTPRISIVIPVYNEEAILHAAVVDLRERLSPLGWNYEVILAENGSKDRTVEIAKELSAKYPELHYVSAGEPNYGGALRKGIRIARGEFVLCDEIDLCDTDFHQRAIEILSSDSADMVIGSKLIAGSSDERPWARHAASLFYTGLSADASSASRERTRTGSKRFGARASSNTWKRASSKRT